MEDACSSGKLQSLLTGHEELRAAALAALVRLDPATAPDLSDQSWATRIAVLEALAETRPKAAGATAARLLSEIHDSDTMGAWLAPLLSRELAIQSLVVELRAAPCSPQTAKLALTTLTAAGRSDMALIDTLNAIIGVINVMPTYDPAWVAALAPICI